MMNDTTMAGDVQASGSSAVSADHLLQNLHMLIGEGTHHRGELRSCYISHPFANDRHNHFRDFSGAQGGWSSSTHIVADTMESSTEDHRRFGASSGLSAEQEPGATKDQSAAACQNPTSSLKQSVDVDLAHRLQSCHICDRRLPSSFQTPFDGMKHDVPPNPHPAHLGRHPHHNP